MDATSATRRSMVTICSPDAARMADSRRLRRRASRLDMGHDVVSPRQICACPTPKSNSAKVLQNFREGHEPCASLGLTAFGVSFILARLFCDSLPDRIGGMPAAI